MFEQATPCIVELFGHQQIAGLVSEQTVGGAAFIRIDVPSVDDNPAFTKIYGPNAIYAFTPTDEATMLLAVKKLRAVPINPYALAIPAKASPIHDPDTYDVDYGDDDEGDDYDEDDDNF